MNIDKFSISIICNIPTPITEAKSLIGRNSCRNTDLISQLTLDVSLGIHRIGNLDTSLRRMSSNWRRSFGNVRSFFGNSLGGLRGTSSLASWAVAGTLAYLLWVRPSQKLRREQEEKAALTAASDRYRYVEKRKPIPDPQAGLLYGSKNAAKKSQSE